MSAHRHPQTGQPVGAVIDARPAGRPAAATLAGRYGRLEKLAIQHVPALWSAVRGQDHLWTYMPSSGPFADAKALAAWAEARAALDDPYFYAVVDTAGQASGVAALANIRPMDRTIEVGHILYAPALQRTRLATEAQYLLARYAFETLGYRRYEWKCDALNAASRRAAQRLGFRFEGIFRQHMIAKGRNRDTAWYAMLDIEWPARKASFERWLGPENFDAEGQQRESLSAINCSAK